MNDKVKDNDNAEKNDDIAAPVERLVMQNIHGWEKDAPIRNGDFFYSGKLPGGLETVICVAQITKSPDGKRYASTLLPPWWRDQIGRVRPTIYFGELHEWEGEWSGPEFGLCCAIA